MGSQRETALEVLCNQQAGELVKQDLVIEYLYDSLGPAADDVIESAYEYADANWRDELERMRNGESDTPVVLV